MPEDSVPFSPEGEQDGSDYTAPQSVSDLLVLQKDYGIRFPGSIMTSFIGGCDGPADTPDPIPNSEVKRPGGENTLTGKIAAAAFYVKKSDPCLLRRGFLRTYRNSFLMI